MGCYEVFAGRHHRHRHHGITRTLFDVVGREIRNKLAGHFHDTYGQALANIYASLLEGINVFDSSVAGLGGQNFHTLDICFHTKYYKILFQRFRLDTQFLSVSVQYTDFHS